MGKKVLAIVVIFLIIGGVFLFLNMQQVTIAVLSGSASVTSVYETEEVGAQQVFLSPHVSLKVRNISRFNYMTMSHGKPRVTKSSPVQIPFVVNLTITFTLITPTNVTLSFEPLKLGKGGVHNFTLVIGPDEGLTGTGTFKLIITFKLTVTRPDGTKVLDLTRIIEVTFTVPKGSVSIRPR